MEYRIPKDPDDKTQGGRSLPGPSGTTDPALLLSSEYCPPGCCGTHNCERYRDIIGEPVPENHEILLVFGGAALRNVSVNNQSLYKV